MLKKTKTIVLLAAVLVSALLLPVSPLQAQTPAASTASAASIAAFKTDPAAWLATARSGTTLLSVQVRDLILADPTTIAAMVTLAKSADALPKSNLGVGLAQAALQFTKNNDTIDAGTIQQEIARANDDALFRAFSAGSNAVETTSLGPTGGDVVGGGVGGTAGNTPGTGSSSTTPAATNTTSTPTQNTATTFTTPTLSSTTFAAASGSTSSVSPTQ